MFSQVMAQRIEHWKLAELTPYPKNPRRHSDAQIAQIAGSIAAFGFNAPILIDSRGNIIAGHGRYLAALKLGLDTVPVVILDHLSETEKRAYILADNKLAELSSFDDDLLRAELAELRDADIDLGALGFDDNELAVLLADAESPDPDADPEEEEIPEAPAEPVTRAGDIWCIAGRRLVCGDCRDRDVVHRLFAGPRANLGQGTTPMNFKGIKRRIQKLAAASEVSVAYQAEEVLRHWRETGELGYPDGRRISVEVFRKVTEAAAPDSYR